MELIPMRDLFRLLMLVLLLTLVPGLAFAQPPNANANAHVQEWWSEQDAGWLGGLVGGTVGIFGAVFGVTAGLGKARSFVLALALVLCGFGVLLLAFGFIAVATGQPYHVYFLFFVIGGVLAFVMGLNYPLLKRRYDQLEFQDLRSMDS
jgi:hypothetical protein